MSGNYKEVKVTRRMSRDANVGRDTWGGRHEFLLSCISYAVGLGNIWRFPYLCYRNGGAAFLIPYLFFLVICGMPIIFMEMAFGQFASLSPLTIWHIAPLFKGVGYGMVMISAIECIYYNVLITWALYYFFSSFYRTVPWSTCDNAWNTDRCVSRSSGGFLGNASSFLDNVTSTVSPMVTTALAANGTNGTEVIRFTTASEEFWERHVLQISDGIDNMGGVRWELFGCLVLAWAGVWLCLVKGIKSSGKVVYFTATFPYLVLFILLIRGVTLPGAKDGLLFYLVPQWEKLLSLQIWSEAAMQICFSTGLALGVIISYASYNNFHHDCYRNAKILPLINSGTSICAGFVIFSVIGFMAHETGSSVDEVITQGPGLVFVVYPEALAKLPFPQIWAIMFFSMLLCVGLGSQLAMFQGVTSAFYDEFESLRKRKLLILTVGVLIQFLLGIPCILNGGIYFLQIMDWYCCTFSVMTLSFAECVVIAWIYGVERFYTDIELMIGYRPCLWWKIVWCFVTPLAIMFVLLFSIISHTPVTYGDYQYPGWAIGVGWIFALCSIVPLPVIAGIKIAMADGPIIQRIRDLLKPTKEWGPAAEFEKANYLASLKGTPLDEMEVGQDE